MTGADWAEIERLFLEAGELAPADRTGFLDRACAETLRPEVESLLNADLARGEFLEAPPSHLAADLLEEQAHGPESIGGR
jgi:hypothetical protein